MQERCVRMGPSLGETSNAPGECDDSSVCVICLDPAKTPFQAPMQLPSRGLAHGDDQARAIANMAIKSICRHAKLACDLAQTPVVPALALGDLERSFAELGSVNLGWVGHILSRSVSLWAL